MVAGGFSVGSWSWGNRTAVLPPRNASTARDIASTARGPASGGRAGADGKVGEAGALFYPEGSPAGIEQLWVWSALVATVDGSDGRGDRGGARGASQEREPF